MSLMLDTTMDCDIMPAGPLQCNEIKEERESIHINSQGPGLNSTFIGGNFGLRIKQELEEGGCCSSVGVKQEVEDESAGCECYGNDCCSGVGGGGVGQCDDSTAIKYECDAEFSNQSDHHNVCEFGGMDHRPLEKEGFSCNQNNATYTACTVDRIKSEPVCLESLSNQQTNELPSGASVVVPTHGGQLQGGMNSVLCQGQGKDASLFPKSDGDMLVNCKIEAATSDTLCSGLPDEPTNISCSGNSQPQAEHGTSKKKKHMCTFCGKHFSSSSGLRRHEILHSDNTRPFTCDLCGRGFSDKTSLRRHEFRKHEIVHLTERLFECKICGRSFADEKGLRNHEEHQHFSDKTCTCPVCGKTFSSVYKLTRHEKMVHENLKPFPCQTCGKSFGDSTLLKRHMLIHNDKKPVLCNVCGKDFISIHEMKKHAVVHLKKELACEVCEKQFANKEKLEKHALSHSVKKPYSCSYCDKGFLDLKSVKRHEAIHSEEARPHKCSHCDKGFQTPSALKRHEAIHLEKKPYSCAVCSKEFSNLANLKTHESTIHSAGVKPLTCKTCGKGFALQSQLNRHSLSHAEDKRFSCSHCGRGFTTRQAMERHEVTHADKKPFECPECGKGCATSHDLARHRLTHSARHICRVCRDRFATEDELRSHEEVHANEEPLPCRFCEKTFVNVKYLRRHELSSHNDGGVVVVKASLELAEHGVVVE